MLSREAMGIVHEQPLMAAAVVVSAAVAVAVAVAAAVALLFLLFLLLLSERTSRVGHFLLYHCVMI